MRSSATLLLFVFLLFAGGRQHLSAQANLNVNFPYDGINRACRLYVPPTYTGTEAVPLVLNLHGFGGNGPEQQDYAKMDAVADTAGFLVAYPTGAFNAWNAGLYYASTTTEDDVGYISTLIDSLGARFNIDPERVYACGMSNGGDMSITLGCQLSERIAAIGPVTGTMLTDVQATCAPGFPMPVLHQHGTADAISNIGGGPGWVPLSLAMRTWATLNGCPRPGFADLPNTDPGDGTRVRRFTSLCSNGAELQLDLIKKGGHTWAGSDANAISFFLFGYTNQDIDGSSELWRFFRRHRRVGAVPFVRQNGTGQQDGKNLHDIGLSGGAGRLQAWPSPAKHAVHVRASEDLSWEDGPVRWALWSIDGRKMAEGSGQWVKGRMAHAVDVSALAPGVYTFILERNGSMASVRFVRAVD